MSNSIQTLIERLEKLREGNREVDARIWAEMDDRDVIGPIDTSCWSGALFGRSRKPPHDERFIWQPGGGAWAKTPAYTSSIDAALTLVPKSFGGSLLIPFGTNSRFPLAMIWKGKNPGIDVRASNPAIALCIAALRARLT